MQNYMYGLWCKTTLSNRFCKIWIVRARLTITWRHKNVNCELFYERKAKTASQNPTNGKRNIVQKSCRIRSAKKVSKSFVVRVCRVRLVRARNGLRCRRNPVTIYCYVVLVRGRASREVDVAPRPPDTRFFRVGLCRRTTERVRSEAHTRPLPRSEKCTKEFRSKWRNLRFSPAFLRKSWRTPIRRFPRPTRNLCRRSTCPEDRSVYRVLWNKVGFPGKKLE